MITNLRENFLYEKLPGAVIDLDEKGLIEAVVGGFQDRLEDLRSYTKKLSDFYTPGALPETGNNAILVDLQSGQGKLYTRSLDITPDTPPSAGVALDAWAAAQLGLDVTQVANVRYGVDLLRRVDASVLGYLAETLGAILYQSAMIADADEAAMQQRLVETWFARLRIKGTAASYEALGRILGFEDVRMTPLWSRVSPRRPEDVGNPQNDPDFSAKSDFVPQQQLSPFYNPLETRDGPFFVWTGTVDNIPSSTQFYTQVVNGFSPYISVGVIATQNGTVVHPATGSYALANGDSYTAARVIPAGSGVQFRAIVEGDAFNGLYVHVVNTGTGSLATLSVIDRLSTVKYRSSYFDLGLTADMDQVALIFGDTAARPNKDLSSGTGAVEGTGTSPYRPWINGSIALPLVALDWTTETVETAGSTVVNPRRQAGPTDRELNVQELVAAGVQVAQALEEVRPATRFPRRSSAGLLVDDTVPYAFYGSYAEIVTTGSDVTYDGSYALTPLPDYVAEVEVIAGTQAFVAVASVDPSNSQIWHYRYTGTSVVTSLSGSYNFSSGSYYFNLSPPSPGSKIAVVWTLTSTEVVRPEPSYAVKLAGGVTALARPEDDENVYSFYGSEFVNGTAYFGTYYQGLAYETVDEYPWRRDIVNGGEVVEVDAYLPSTPDVAVQPISAECVFVDQTGCEYSVYALKSTLSNRMRYRVVTRPTDTTYTPGALPIGYQGTFKSLSNLTATETALINTLTDAETLFNTGYSLYHVGLAQGVLVADVPKFYGPHHRQNLVAWLPFNEHPEDALAVADHSAVNGFQYLKSVDFTDRQWDSTGTHGWCLSLRPGAAVVSQNWRDWADEQTVSFWFNAGTTTGTAVNTLVTAGVVRFDYNSSSHVLSSYAGTAFVGSVAVAPGQWDFVYVRKTSTEAWFGNGANSISEVGAVNFFGTGSATDQIVVQTFDGTLGVHDLRVWNSLKSAGEMDLVRYYAPTATVVNYPIGFMYTANAQDRYGLLVLPNGWVTTGDLPASIRRPSLALVRRYKDTGVYEGESRFKETGLGSGHGLPALYQLGIQYGAVTGNGTAVVATEHGELPGVNALWLGDTSAGTYVVVFNGTGTNTQSGTLSPWPNIQVQTNPCRDRIWVQGTDSYVYEVMLDGTLASTSFVANRLARLRTDAEIEVNPVYGAMLSTGTFYSAWLTGWMNGTLINNVGTVSINGTGGVSQTTIIPFEQLSLAEQPTGAQVTLVQSGTYLTVNDQGTVFLKTGGTDPDTAPLYLYCNSRIKSFGVSGTGPGSAYSQWTDQTNTAADQRLDVTPMPDIVDSVTGYVVVPARGNAGLIEFNGVGPLAPGRYRLKVESGNIGQTDADFDGFNVEITINSTVLEKRLLTGLTGYNIRGFDTFEFDLTDSVLGAYLISFRWSNPFSDAATNTKRQLAIFSYELRQLTTELYQVTVGVSAPTTTLIDATNYNSGTTPGGWLLAINSYGTLAYWEHESVVYPANDTTVSKQPLSDILTGLTCEKREDILFPAGDVVISNTGSFVFPFIGTVTDIVTGTGTTPALIEDIYWEPDSLDMGGMVAWVAGDQNSAYGVDGLTSLTFLEAYNNEGYDIRQSGTLVSVSFPNLVDVNWSSGGGYGLTVRQNANLTTVSLPVFVPSDSASVWFDENALSQASVDHILGRCAASATFLTGQVVLNGGSNSPPSATGLTYVTMLTTGTRSVFVSTN